MKMWDIEKGGEYYFEEAATEKVSLQTRTVGTHLPFKAT